MHLPNELRYRFGWVEVQAQRNVVLCTPWWRQGRVPLLRQFTAYLDTQAYARERLQWVLAHISSVAIRFCHHIHFGAHLKSLSCCPHPV